MSAKTFTCMRDGLTIRGMEYLPDGFEEGKKYLVIIVSHGFLGNYASVAAFCEEFAGMGYVSYCFNFCGGGNGPEEGCPESDGKSTDMTVMTEVEDLTAVINFAKNKPYNDHENLILMGVSQGGFVSGLTAAKYGNEISRLIMIYPALCIPDDARRGRVGGADYDPQNVPERIECATVLGKAYHEEVVGMEPYLELSAYQGPVLILHGMEDDVVNYSYSVRAKESYKKGQCHLQLIRDMGHALNEEQLASAKASIRQFLKGRKEIFTIRVIITHTENDVEGDVQKNNVYFTGYCDTEYFQGTIQPEGCDVQEYYSETDNKMRAEYTLTGLDYRGETCRIHIVNQKKDRDWKPSVQTDSTALEWLNHADLTAVLEYGNGGPTVRIFAPVNEKK